MATTRFRSTSGRAGTCASGSRAFLQRLGQSETDLRLSAEIRRIECEPTAGELGALLREATLVKSLLPAHNRALRRKADAGVMTLREDGTPAFVPAAAYVPGMTTPAYGPFSSRRAMREALAALAHDHALCWRRLGLERRSGPCFSRQLKRCRGACEGAEPIDAHDARFRAALATLAIPAWPFDGPALVREASEDGERVDVHVVRDWAWLGTARDDAELYALLESPREPAFDVDVTKLPAPHLVETALGVRACRRGPFALLIAAPRTGSSASRSVSLS